MKINNYLIIPVILVFIVILLFFANYFLNKSYQTCAIELYDENGGLFLNTLKGDICNYVKLKCNKVSYCKFEVKPTGTRFSIGSCVCIPKEFRY